MEYAKITHGYEVQHAKKKAVQMAEEFVTKKMTTLQQVYYAELKQLGTQFFQTSFENDTLRSNDAEFRKIIKE